MFARRVCFKLEVMLGLLFVLGLGLQLTAAQSPDFFDFGLDNPLSLIWNNRHQDEAVIGTTNRNECTSSESNDRTGICMKAAACRYQGGTSIGRSTCRVWNTCCIIQRTSNQTSTQRVTYFVNPSNPRSRPQPQHVHVHLKSNTCQLRVDIVSMSVLPPTDTGMNEVECLEDYFKVEPQFEDNNIPDICGKQSNQHFYIQLDDRIHTTHHTHVTGVTFSVYLNRNSSAEATWNMKITQLECPAGFRGIHDKKHNSKDVSNNAGSDYYQLAPRGCLQYFTEPSGEFHNFGFSSTSDTTLTTGQNYAICFKRNPGVCSIRFTHLYLTLRVMGALDPDPTVPDDCTDEYIFAPERMTRPRRCRFDEALNVYEINPNHNPGPLYVRFYSAHPATTTVVNPGFSIRYEIVNCRRLGTTQ